MKVLKFGGSSLSDSSQFAKVKNIVESDGSRQIVVVSAPGRRNSEDSKITDLLYLCHAHLKYDVPFDNIRKMIVDRYVEIERECGIDIGIEAEINKVFDEMNKRTSVDYIASRGEYFNAMLMAEYLGFKFVDAADWLVFNFKGEADLNKSEDNLRELYEVYGKIVTPGFYGAMPNGEIKVFSRGGSDITGAIAAAAVKATVYENWTDVNGIKMVDPRIVDNPKTIEHVTYDELRALSYMGAAVLHEDTILPVRIKDIPVNIRNTNEPDNPGTIIREDFEQDSQEEKDRFITGIAGKKDFSIVNIYESSLGEDKIILMRKVLAIFDKFDVPVEQIPSGVDSLSVVVPSDAIEGKKYEIMAALREETQIDRCDITEGVSIIAIVGRQMAYRTGVSGRIFGALGDNNINIRTIEQGADEITIMIGVYTDDFNKTVKILYDSFAM
ncbi:MAG: aspartate kinase [Clostridiales bacterium]|nr:aspartate kinase [Candidatus Crickella equi]